MEFEAGKQTFSSDTLRALGQALEAAGVDFSADNGGGRGVKLKEGKWWA
jgi:hypothetical protein